MAPNRRRQSRTPDVRPQVAALHQKLWVTVNELSNAADAVKFSLCFHPASQSETSGLLIDLSDIASPIRRCKTMPPAKGASILADLRAGLEDAIAMLDDCAGHSEGAESKWFQATAATYRDLMQEIGALRQSFETMEAIQTAAG